MGKSSRQVEPKLPTLDQCGVLKVSSVVRVLLVFVSRKIIYVKRESVVEESLLVGVSNLSHTETPLFFIWRVGRRSSGPNR